MGNGWHLMIDMRLFLQVRKLPFFKHIFLLLLCSVLLTACSTPADAKPNTHPSSSTVYETPRPTQPRPSSPITQDQAVAIAIEVAQGWGDQNAQLVRVNRQVRGDFIKLLKARGDDVLIAGSGDVWIVDLSRKFTPSRVPPDVSIQCNVIFVAIDADSGDIISVGCR